MSDRFHDDDHYAKLKPQPIDVFRQWAEANNVPRRYLYSYQEAAYALIRAWLKNDDPRRDLRKASRMIAEIVEDIDKRKWGALDDVPYVIDEAYTCGGELNIAVEDDSECPDCCGPGDGSCICFVDEPIEVKVDDGFRITWDGRKEDKRINYSTMSPLTRYLKDAINLTDEQVLALEELDSTDVEFAAKYCAHPIDPKTVHDHVKSNVPEGRPSIREDLNAEAVKLNGLSANWWCPLHAEPADDRTTKADRFNNTAYWFHCKSCDSWWRSRSDWSFIKTKDTPRSYWEPEVEAIDELPLKSDIDVYEETKSILRRKARAESLDQEPIPEDERKALVDKWVKENMGTVEYQEAVDHAAKSEDRK